MIFRSKHLVGSLKHLLNSNAETYLSGEKRELVEAIGFDPSQITQQQIDEAIAMTDLVLNDETLRDILYRFVKDYAGAQHAIEITEVAGSGAFELILTNIVAAVTGGAGVVAAVGSKMHLVRKFNKVGDLLADFAQATKRIKNRKKAFNGKNTGPGNLESVDGSVKKTDAHGAETGNHTQRKLNTNPKDIRAASKNWPKEKKARFDLADSYYREAGKTNYDNHLRGIDFDKPVEIRSVPEGTTLYQYSYPDRLTGMPKTGDYFYENRDINPNQLGFEVNGEK